MAQAGQKSAKVEREQVERERERELVYHLRAPSGDERAKSRRCVTS